MGKKLISQKVLLTLIAVGVLLINFTFFWYFVVYLPQENQRKAEEERRGVEKLELETARNKSCDERDELSMTPQDLDITNPEMWKWGDRIADAIRYISSAEDGNYKYSWWHYRQLRLDMDEAPTRGEIDATIQKLINRYQDWYAALTECNRLTGEYNWKYGE